MAHEASLEEYTEQMWDINILQTVCISTATPYLSSPLVFALEEKYLPISADTQE